MKTNTNNPRLRVAVLIRHYSRSGGGAERYCVELTERLADLHEVHVFAQAINETSPNITFHTVPRLLKRPRYINQLLFSWFTRSLTKDQFDIIHSHDMVTHANVYTLHVLCVKTLWTKTSGWKKWLLWLNTAISPRKLAYLWLEKIQLSPRKGKRLIAVSELMVRNIVLNYPKTDGQITIAYPGITINTNTRHQKEPSWRTQYSIPDNAFVLLFIANDFKKKGLQSLLAALGKINNHEIHLIVAGNGRQDQLQVPNTIKPTIHFLGVVHTTDILYLHADVLIHPTLIDTYGMVVLEAMAHRLPVIVSNQKYCGLSEHLSSKQAILLDNPQDTEEIAEQVLFLFHNQEERNTIAQRGFEKSQEISWDQTFQQSLTAYRTIHNQPIDYHMKVSGFTFIRNGEMLGYPFIESIESALPILDEFVIAVGKSDDNTLNLIRAIQSEKIQIIETNWNEAMQDRGFVYAQQKMIAQFNCTGDWAFYLEGDEVLHEKDLNTIRSSMECHLNNPEVEALYFDYYHFYGKPDQIGIAGYKRAPRIIRNTIRNYSPDGLFFVVMDKNKQGRYPKATYAGCHIYHYGHVRKADRNNQKIKQVSKYWGDENPDTFSTYGNIDLGELRPFTETHPTIMDKWLRNEAELEFIHNSSYKVTLRDRKHRLRFWLDEKLAWDISKKHYTEAKL